MTDIDYKKNLADQMETGNQRSYDELRDKLGTQFDMNTSDTRRETLIETLVNCGIMTEEQYLDFEIAFHTKVETALNNFWAQLRGQEEKPSHLAVVKKPSQLLDATGRPIK